MAVNPISSVNMMGLLRIRVKRGINLAIRDIKSSDPYVIVRLGKQVRFTHSLSVFQLFNFSILLL